MPPADPDPIVRVPRDQVHAVVKDMLKFDPRVRWISIVLDEPPAVPQTFTVTPFVEKPF